MITPSPRHVKSFLLLHCTSTSNGCPTRPLGRARGCTGQVWPRGSGCIWLDGWSSSSVSHLNTDKTSPQQHTRSDGRACDANPVPDVRGPPCSETHPAFVYVGSEAKQCDSAFAPAEAPAGRPQMCCSLGTRFAGGARHRSSASGSIERQLSAGASLHPDVNTCTASRRLSQPSHAMA